MHLKSCYKMTGIVRGVHVSVISHQTLSMEIFPEIDSREVKPDGDNGKARMTFRARVNSWVKAGGQNVQTWFPPCHSRVPRGVNLFRA